MAWQAAEHSDARIKAHNLSGERIGVAGVGEGDQRLTCPAKLITETVLGLCHWIKEATPGAPKWYEILGDWKPAAIVLTNGRLANPDDPVGVHGDTITIIEAKISRGESQEAERADFAGVKTPTTPSEEDSDRSWSVQTTRIPIPIETDPPRASEDRIGNSRASW